MNPRQKRREREARRIRRKRFESSFVLDIPGVRKISVKDTTFVAHSDVDTTERSYADTTRIARAFYESVKPFGQIQDGFTLDRQRLDFERGVLRGEISAPLHVAAPIGYRKPNDLEFMYSQGGSWTPQARPGNLSPCGIVQLRRIFDPIVDAQYEAQFVQAAKADIERYLATIDPTIYHWLPLHTYWKEEGSHRIYHANTVVLRRSREGAEVGDIISVADMNADPKEVGYYLRVHVYNPLSIENWMDRNYDRLNAIDYEVHDYEVRRIVTNGVESPDNIRVMPVWVRTQ